MLHLHFTMDDNLSLSASVKARYESLYSGVFYDRFIRGLWVVAEGLIYTMFNKDFHVVPDAPRPYDRYYISIDYGTANPTSMGLWARAGGKWYRIREYYYNSRKVGRQLTDEEYYAELEKLAGDLPIRAVIVDPSAASFIEVIRAAWPFLCGKGLQLCPGRHPGCGHQAPERGHLHLLLLHGLHPGVWALSLGRKGPHGPAHQGE